MFNDLFKKDKLKHFYNDQIQVTKQFKGLYNYGLNTSAEERKAFHIKNYRRVFSVCRTALDEYARRGITDKRKKDKDDEIKRPCEIMDALTRLCQDIPHLVSQNWNHNALTELFTKFLNFNTNEEIRKKSITFIFVVINAAKKQAHKKYVECLKYSSDFTPFCIQTPYDQYYNNFKKNLIVAQEALPWIRTGPTNKAHCMKMLQTFFGLVKDAGDFDFWYNFIVKHMYPQFYYKCTCQYGQLVNKLFTDDEKHELDKMENVEKEGFGTLTPPTAIQSFLSEWITMLLNNEAKGKIMLNNKIYILYCCFALKHCMLLPMSESNIIYSGLKRYEKWILGINLTPKFKNEIQNYFQIIITDILGLFTIKKYELSAPILHIKLNLCSYGIYLLRLISGEPYINLSQSSWKCLINGLINLIKYFKSSQLQDILSKKKQYKQEIEERIIHPAVYCLYKVFTLCSISNSLIANKLLNSFKFSIINSKLLHYKPFVIQWREIIRNITTELLSLICPTQRRKSKNFNFRSNSVHSHATSVNHLPSQSLPLSDNSYYFSLEERLAILRVDLYSFRNLSEAFMIWDRLLHLLGAPHLNPSSHTRQIHLEGFTDSLKIFISSLGIKERNAARIKKDHAMRVMKEKQAKLNGISLKKKKQKVNSSSDALNKLNTSVYGFQHSLIPVPIDVSNLMLNGNLPDTIRKNLPLPSREQLPQSTTLINIYMPWLCEICEQILSIGLPQQVKRINEFNQAFSSLSYIFLTYCGENNYDIIHLSTYYKIIKLSFNNNKVSQKIRSIVMHECNKGCIFGKNLNGINILIPDFLDAMKSIIHYDLSNNNNKNKIQKYSLKMFNEQEANDSLSIAMSLICFGSHFNKLSINSNKKINFQSIKQIISDVFSYIANIDKLPINIINTIINGSVLLIYDEITSTKDIKIISTSIKSIVKGTNINKLSMAMVATNAIESLSPICAQICSISDVLISKNLFSPFLVNMFEFIQNAANQDNINRKEICRIATQQLYCCLEWMFKFPPQILTNNDLMINYFRVLHQSLCLSSKIKKNNNKDPLNDVVLAAKTSKMMLFHYLGNFPLPHDTGALSSNASDDYKGSQEGNVFLAYDKNILMTANDRILAHQAGPEPGVRLLLRDESGKHAWNFTPCSILPKPINTTSASASASPKLRKKKKKQNNNNNVSLPPPPSTPPPSPAAAANNNNNNNNKMNADDVMYLKFNGNLTKNTEILAKVAHKKKFQLKSGASNTDDGLKQILNYVSLELTPPAGAMYKKKKKKVIKISKNNKNNPNNTGSFPNLIDKSHDKLKKYMSDQKKEELELYLRFVERRQANMIKMKKFQDELSKECEKKDGGGYKHKLNDMKIREAVTGYDCSRFLLGHLGILTPGNVLGIRDSLFSDIINGNDNDNNDKQLNIDHGSPQSARISSKKQHNNYNKPVIGGDNKKRHASDDINLNNIRTKNGHVKYFHGLDQNLLAMFGNRDNAFHRRLRLLDQASMEREKHKIGIVYVAPDQDDQKLILANISGSKSFNRFLSKLGWKIDLLTHEGFDGGMNSTTTGRYCKYYNTATYEMAFHISINMPTNYDDKQQMDKKKHIGNDHINIIWSDHSREYITDTMHSQFNHVQIVIYPLNNGLYRIKIHKKIDINHFGPLLNNMIITEHILSILVRITSLNANRTVRYASPIYTRPCIERKKYLDEAFDRNSHKEPDAILGAFFPYMANRQ